jgi:hypothetical protein
MNRPDHVIRTNALPGPSLSFLDHTHRCPLLFDLNRQGEADPRNVMSEALLNFLANQRKILIDNWTHRSNIYFVMN